MADSGARLAGSRLPCSASCLAGKIRRREGVLCTAISSACTRKTFCLFKRFLPLPKAEARDHKRTYGVNSADMGEFVTNACNEQND